MRRIIAGKMLVGDDELHFRDDDAQKKLKDLIVKGKGDSETAVMSQAAATEEFDKLSEEIADNYKIGVRLTEGTDLDTLIEPGVYYCDSFSLGSTLLNCPDPNAFKMVVDNLYASTRPQQVIYSSISGAIYRRAMHGSGWGVWEKFATITDIENLTENVNNNTDAIKDNFRIGVRLETGTDLDTLTNAGVYYSDTFSISNSLLHCPTVDSFKMVINNLYALTRPQQVIYCAGQSRVYRRTMLRAGWTDWVRFATYEEIADNRKIAMFGDSITWGTDGNGSGDRVSKPYPKIVGEQMKITCDNYGVGTSGYLKPGSDGKTAFEKISSTDITPYDYITLAFGVNDLLNYTLGEWNSTDESTIMGQMNKVINYIYTQNPNCVVIVIAPWNGRNVGTFPKYKYGIQLMIDMDEAYKNCCEYYGLPYISQKDCPINGYTMSTLMGADGVHPSILGYERIGGWIAGKLKSLIG